MGVWGTAIFSSDDASDLRDEYRSLIGDGVSGPDATDKLIAEWRSTLEGDPHSASTFWLALAVTQWKCGRLEERTQRAAIQAIDDGSALAAWKGSRDETKRAAVLQTTRKLLNTPPPPPRRISKTFRASCDWRPGDLIAYRLLSGSFIVFQMIEPHTDKGGVAPICEIFDWIGSSLPTADTLAHCSMRPQIVSRREASVPNQPPRYRLMILQAGKREFPQARVIALGARLAIQHPPLPKGKSNPALVCLWRQLDQTLQRQYGLS